MSIVLLTRGSILMFAIIVDISPGLLNARKSALPAFSANVTSSGASVSSVYRRYSEPCDTCTVVVVCEANVPCLGGFGALANRKSVGVAITDVVVVRLAQVRGSYHQGCVHQRFVPSP
jgi:hypothetical protein